MKTKGFLFPIVCVAVVCATVALLRMEPRTVPYEQCSEVYKRYAEVEGVRASFVKDFWLNDSVAVDVVLLEATDSAGWVRLQRDLAITPIPPEAAAIMNNNSVNIWLASKQDYSMRTDSVVLNNDLIAMQYFKRSIAIFNINSEEQMEAILFYQSNSIKNSN